MAESFFYKNTITISYRLPTIFLRSAHASARLQICANAFPCPLMEFRKLSIAGIQNGLNFVLRLFGYWYVSIQVFINKQAAEHLQKVTLFKTEF